MGCNRKCGVKSKCRPGGCTRKYQDKFIGFKNVQRGRGSGYRSYDSLQGRGYRSYSSLQGRGFFGDVNKFLKKTKILSTLGMAASPFAALIPGVGPVAAAGLASASSVGSALGYGMPRRRRRRRRVM